MSPARLLPLLLLCACASGGGAGSPSAPRRTNPVLMETPRGIGTVLTTSDDARVHRATVPLSLPQARTALLRVYADLGLRGSAVTPDGRVTAGPSTVVRRLGGERLSRYLDCGATVGNPNADSYTVSLQLTSRLVAEGPAATRVETWAEATGRPVDTAGERVPCTSTGELERRIAAMLVTQQAK